MICQMGQGALEGKTQRFKMLSIDLILFSSVRLK